MIIAKNSILKMIDTVPELKQFYEDQPSPVMKSQLENILGIVLDNQMRRLFDEDLFTAIREENETLSQRLEIANELVNDYHDKLIELGIIYKDEKLDQMIEKYKKFLIIPNRNTRNQLEAAKVLIDAFDKYFQSIATCYPHLDNPELRDKIKAFKQSNLALIWIDTRGNLLARCVEILRTLQGHPAFGEARQLISDIEAVEGGTK